MHFLKELNLKSRLFYYLDNPRCGNTVCKAIFGNSSSLQNLEILQLQECGITSDCMSFVQENIKHLTKLQNPDLDCKVLI